MRTCSLLLAVLMLAPAPALAQADEPGTKDHPEIPRFPGFYIHWAEEREFSSYEFPLTDDDKFAKKEGRHFQLEYRLRDDAKQPGSIEIVRNYENAFKKRGGKAVFKTDDGTSAEATLMMPLGKSERWMAIQASPGSYRLVVVEVKAMEQQIEVSASEMLDALNKDGFIALYGILFDTGKDAIKPESEPLLAEIATLLTSNPGLKLAVEGHTDNVGNPKANQDLSQRRAASVKKHLVAKGVDGKRLETSGWGDTRPVSDNRTEDGRAKNRRVELVKK